MPSHITRRDVAKLLFGLQALVAVPAVARACQERVLLPSFDREPPSASETEIPWDPSLPYADNSEIHYGVARLYTPTDHNGMTVCVNAGHGTPDGESYRTLCHPDGTPKVTGGSTAEGSIYAPAVSSGTEMLDGTSEADAVLRIAVAARDGLLADGYAVLMPRVDCDCGLDNVARAVLANAFADCHVSIHLDSTDSGKGLFFIGVPDVGGYRGMEPVESMWGSHEALGWSLVDAAITEGVGLHGDGRMPLDLTQTSYSTVPSVDLECGDRATVIDDGFVHRMGRVVVRGVGVYFGREASE